MIIKTAIFQGSSTDVSRKPKLKAPEYAFIGRSNVGKSSLINMLCGRKDLAKTSSMPGKTILVNHFLINGKWYLVDLPGYGFAKASKKAQATLKAMIEDYVRSCWTPGTSCRRSTAASSPRWLEPVSPLPSS